MQEQSQKATDKTPTALEVAKAHLDRSEASGAAEVLSTLHVADAAQILEALTSEERVLVVEEFDPELTAHILAQLDAETAVAISLSLAQQFVSEVLDRASPDVAADILRGLPEERRLEVINGMSRAGDVTPLLAYEDETAGGLMVTDYVVLREWMVAEEAVAYLRGRVPNKVSSNYLLVLDRRNSLEGVVHLRDLVLAPADARVRDLMDLSVISVGPDVDQEECARIMARYDVAQLPVVDEEGHILGVILTEHIIDVLEDEATEDILHLGSMGASERVLGPMRRSFTSRLPWLLLNLGTVVIAASVINAFQSTISSVVFIVAFLPMVASQGGIAGTQTLTLITRGMALGDLTFANAKRVLVREAVLGVANGLVIGVVAGALAYAWKGSFTLGLVIFGAMVLNLIVAGLFGTMVPLALKALRMDPALGAAVVVTTFTDVAGFGFTLAFASFWLT